MCVDALCQCIHHLLTYIVLSPIESSFHSNVTQRCCAHALAPCSLSGISGFQRADVGRRILDLFHFHSTKHFGRGGKDFKDPTMASKTFARRMLFSTTRRLASSEGSSSSSSSNISATAQYDSSLGRTVQSHGASSSSSSFSNAAPSSTQSLLRTGLNNLAAPTASAPALRTFSPRQVCNL